MDWEHLSLQPQALNEVEPYWVAKFKVLVLCDCGLQYNEFNPKKCNWKIQNTIIFQNAYHDNAEGTFIQCAIFCKYLRYVSSTAMILSDNWQSWWMTVIVITWWTLDSNRCTKHYSWKETFAKNEFSLSRQIGPSPGYIFKDTMLRVLTHSK